MSSPARCGWEIDSEASICNASTPCVPDADLASSPTDILLKIFSLCGPENWPNISLVCKRFYFILGPDSFLWEQIARRLLIVNQISPAFCSKYTFLIFETFTFLIQATSFQASHQSSPAFPWPGVQELGKRSLSC